MKPRPIRILLIAVALLAASGFAQAQYDSGSTDSNILKSCKNFGSTWNTAGHFALTMDCNTMLNGVIQLISSGWDLDNNFGNESGVLKYNTNGSIRDFSDECINESISSSSTAVTLSANCNNGTATSGCDTASGLNTNTCPATSINLADYASNPG